ncbi:serine/threonine protein kinase [Streptomyces sp. Ru71]|uniref:serine/threonine-protein kinase n=1 Tax=Streptomyces sp. Ru71 TaxID=2080746 RepID=UPI000CDE516A|nr:serine/threonine-protein kinase [Streptomyces sp. Ru71]POX55650.1 serine/threonine protein kinase [Streptomyces sp. Ru71]
MAPRRNTGAGAEAELPEYAGHYLLESRLGSGGMGVVHLARSPSGMRLAVKVVHAEFARDPEFRGRFRQEIVAARRVSGAFTAPVVDADAEAERPWMATLFIPGPTLSEHVKQNGPMGAAELRRLMAGLAEALRDIHRVGVVHRDLKPSNVLLAEDGPKVIDFGISRPKDSELRTETGKLIGTPPFMAPEQFRRPRQVGPAADIFALGSVMVHAATGRGPFDSDSPYVVAYSVVHDEPDLTGVPGNLAPLVRRCLAKEPEERPTPDELMRELRSVAASYDTQAFIPAQRAADGPSPSVPGESGDDESSRDSGNSGATGGGRGAERKESASARGGAGASGGWAGAGGGGAGAGGGGAGAGGGGAQRAAVRRRRLGRVLLAAGAVALLAGGALAVVPLIDGGPARSAAPRSAPAGFAGWEAEAAVAGGGAAECAQGGGRLLCARPGMVFALDPGDGRLLWRHPAARGRAGGPPVVAGGLVYAPADQGRRLEALDPASGEVRRSQDVPAYSGFSAVGGMLLLTGAHGTVTGVDAATGATVWSHRIPGQAMPSFEAFAGSPLAFSASVSGDGKHTRVTAVNPRTGDVRWDTRLDGMLEPVGAEDGSVYLLALDRAYGEATGVVRHSPATGVTRRVALPVSRQGVQATVRGDVVYLMAVGGSLDAVDMGARRRLWSLETSVSRASAPSADGDHVYVTAADGRLLGVDARSGDLVGQTRARLGSGADRVPAALPVPVVSGGRVYASAPDGTVFAVPAGAPGDW